MLASPFLVMKVLAENFGYLVDLPSFAFSFFLQKHSLLFLLRIRYACSLFVMPAPDPAPAPYPAPDLLFSSSPAPTPSPAHAPIKVDNCPIDGRVNSDAGERRTCIFTLQSHYYIE